MFPSGRSRRPPATYPTPPCPTGTPSSSPNALVPSMPPDSTLPRHRPRAHRQTPEPGPRPHGAVPSAPRRPNRHGVAAHAQTPRRTRLPEPDGGEYGLSGRKKIPSSMRTRPARSAPVTGARPAGYSGSWRRHIMHSRDARERSSNPTTGGKGSRGDDPASSPTTAANNRRRLKVAKILESWGYRIQESVFQLRLDTDSPSSRAPPALLPPSQTPKTSSTSTPSPSCADRADILGAAIALDDVGLCRECGEGMIASSEARGTESNASQVYASLFIRDL